MKILKHVLKKAMYGILPDVKTFVIITPENPMGVSLTKKENMIKSTDFKNYLKDGRYKYIRVNGKYGVTEKPFVVFNIQLEEAKHIGNKYNQESFIFAKNKDNKSKSKNVEFEYWEKEENKPYKKKDSIDQFDFKDNADDFFTKLKSWKFNIPFSIFESIMTYEPYDKNLNEDVVKSINGIITEMLLDITPLKRQYILRGHINACINTGKPYEDIGE